MIAGRTATRGRRIALTLAILAWSATAFAQPSSVSGIVRDEAGPIAGAIVRVQGSTGFARTDRQGKFMLDVAAGRLRLTASALSHYIAGPLAAGVGESDVVFNLEKLADHDNLAYVWLSSFQSGGEERNCENCHADPANHDSLLPFDEWQRDAHAGAARNKRFLSMYNGTDLSGNHRSPLTRFGTDGDYGRVPLPPDPATSYFGPGFKLDFPKAAGNCAACHAPVAAARAPYGTDLNTLADRGREGIGCDLCHKISAVRLAASTGLPYANTPGVLSISFRRPSGKRQLFLGPFDDVAPGDDSFSPIHTESQICAPCHHAQFWGVTIYDSFGEWLASPYATDATRTCQDCHMPRRGAVRIAREDKGGLQRDPQTIFSHKMPGADDVVLLRGAARLRVQAGPEGSSIRVEVSVTNQNAGHHIPTDHPARNILLIVSAKDSRGEPLRQLSGPVLPEWAGTGDRPDEYAGRPGRGFAKVLEERWTRTRPTAAYWNPTVLREDTRIPALTTDTSVYEFSRNGSKNPVRVTARLIYRRAFQSLNRQKLWNAADVIMTENSVEVPQ